MTQEELDKLLSPDMKDDLICDLRARLSKRAEEDRLRRIIREETGPSDLGLSALCVRDALDGLSELGKTIKEYGGVRVVVSYGLADGVERSSGILRGDKRMFLQWFHLILPFVGLVAGLAFSNLTRRRDTTNHKETK